MKNLLHWTAALSLGLAFAGCGGGNGGIVTPTPTSIAPAALYNAPIKVPNISQFNGLNNKNQILAVNTARTQSLVLDGPTATPQVLKFYEGNYILARGINNKGNLMGGANVTALPSGTILPAMYWSSSSATPQPLIGPPETPPPATDFPRITTVSDINDNGAMVGVGPQDDRGVALYWEGASKGAIVLATASPEGNASALSVNSNNAIVGIGISGNGLLFWPSPTATSQPMARLAEQTGNAQNMAINDKGNVFIVDANGVTSFYSSPTATPIRLPFLPNASSDWDPASIALIGGYSMNNNGVVVGTSTDASGNLHAVRWINGAVQDLNTLLPANSGWVLQQATFINDGGVIVGKGIYNGSTAFFYMSPK